MSIKKLIVTILLCAIGQTFCMEQERERVPDLEEVTLEDGHTYLECTHWRHFRQVAGNVVAVVSEDKIFKNKQLHRMNADDQTCYGLISTKPWNWDNGGLTGYAFHRCVDDNINILLLKDRKPACVRLLTLTEACFLDKGLKAGSVKFPWREEDRCAARKIKALKLGDLMPTARRKYMQNLMIEEVRERFYNLCIATKRIGIRLPLDLRKKIWDDLLDADAEAIVQTTDLETPFYAPNKDHQ